MALTVLLFADGGPAIGAGHQARCAVLADRLEERGHHPVLACRGLAGSPHARIWGDRLTFELDEGIEPALALQQACAAIAADVVVVDHYGIPGEALGDIDAPCAVIVDAPGRDLAGAALVIQTAPGASPADHPGIPSLCGVAFALVAPCFAAARPLRQADGGAVLVVLGGTDAMGLTAAVCASLLAATAHDVTAVVADADLATRALLERHGDRLRLLPPMAQAALAREMAASRAVVATASGVALEASAVGAPLVALEVVDNQRVLAAGLRQAGVAVLTAQELAGLPTAMAAALAGPGGLAVDGLGAGRVAERLGELPRAAAGLRPVTWADADLLLGWANDPEVRRASFSSATVTRAEHLAWLARRLGDPDTRMWIAGDGRPLGTIRLQRDGAAATVSLTVAPQARGRGQGARLLAALRDWVAATGFCARIDAEVALDNPASLALFTHAGYARMADAIRAGRPAARFSLELPR